MVAAAVTEDKQGRVLNDLAAFYVSEAHFDFNPEEDIQDVNQMEAIGEDEEEEIKSSEEEEEAVIIQRNQIISNADVSRRSRPNPRSRNNPRRGRNSKILDEPISSLPSVSRAAPRRSISGDSLRGSSHSAEPPNRVTPRRSRSGDHLGDSSHRSNQQHQPARAPTRRRRSDEGIDGSTQLTDHRRAPFRSKSGGGLAMTSPAERASSRRTSSRMSSHTSPEQQPYEQDLKGDGPTASIRSRDAKESSLSGRRTRSCTEDSNGSTSGRRTRNYVDGEGSSSGRRTRINSSDEQDDKISRPNQRRARRALRRPNSGDYKPASEESGDDSDLEEKPATSNAAAVYAHAKLKLVTESAGGDNGTSALDRLKPITNNMKESSATRRSRGSKWNSLKHGMEFINKTKALSEEQERQSKRPSRMRREDEAFSKEEEKPEALVRKVSSRKERASSTEGERSESLTRRSSSRKESAPSPSGSHGCEGERERGESLTRRLSTRKESVSSPLGSQDGERENERSSSKAPRESRRPAQSTWGAVKGSVDFINVVKAKSKNRRSTSEEGSEDLRCMMEKETSEISPNQRALEEKQAGYGRTSSPSKRPGSDSNFTAPEQISIKVKLTILAGRDLVAKDSNLIGKKTTSDPYVEVWADNERVGKTSIFYKTLNPSWEKGNIFQMFLEGMNHQVVLKIYDWNRIGGPDAMGTILLTIPAKTGDIADWFPVPKDSAKNASGDIKIRLETTRLITESNVSPKINKADSSLLQDIAYKAKIEGKNEEAIDLDVMTSDEKFSEDALEFLADDKSLSGVIRSEAESKEDVSLELKPTVKETAPEDQASTAEEMPKKPAIASSFKSALAAGEAGGAAKENWAMNEDDSMKKNTKWTAIKDRLEFTNRLISKPKAEHTVQKKDTGGQEKDKDGESSKKKGGMWNIASKMKDKKEKEEPPILDYGLMMSVASISEDVLADIADLAVPTAVEEDDAENEIQSQEETVHGAPATAEEKLQLDAGDDGTDSEKELTKTAMGVTSPVTQPTTEDVEEEEKRSDDSTNQVQSEMKEANANTIKVLTEATEETVCLPVERHTDVNKPLQEENEDSCEINGDENFRLLSPLKCMQLSIGPFGSDIGNELAVAIHGIFDGREDQKPVIHLMKGERFDVEKHLRVSNKNQHSIAFNEFSGEDKVLELKPTKQIASIKIKSSIPDGQPPVKKDGNKHRNDLQMEYDRLAGELYKSQERAKMTRAETASLQQEIEQRRNRFGEVESRKQLRMQGLENKNIILKRSG